MPPLLNCNMKQKPEICDPSEKSVQVILTDAFQLGYLLETLLGFTGAADITVSTFSTGEEFLRKLIALRRIGLVRTARLFTDFKAAEKTAKINAIKAKYNSQLDAMVTARVKATMLGADTSKIDANYKNTLAAMATEIKNA